MRALSATRQTSALPRLQSARNWLLRWLLCPALATLLLPLPLPLPPPPQQQRPLQRLQCQWMPRPRPLRAQPAPQSWPTQSL